MLVILMSRLNSSHIDNRYCLHPLAPYKENPYRPQQYTRVQRATTTYDVVGSAAQQRNRSDPIGPQSRDNRNRSTFVSIGEQCAAPKKSHVYDNCGFPTRAVCYDIAVGPVLSRLPLFRHGRPNP